MSNVGHAYDLLSSGPPSIKCEFVDGAENGLLMLSEIGPAGRPKHKRAVVRHVSSHGRSTRCGRCSPTTRTIEWSRHGASRPSLGCAEGRCSG